MEVQWVIDWHELQADSCESIATWIEEEENRAGRVTGTGLGAQFRERDKAKIHRAMAEAIRKAIT